LRRAGACKKALCLRHIYLGGARSRQFSRLLSSWAYSPMAMNEAASASKWILGV
jgi:hypothetical protein